MSKQKKISVQQTQKKEVGFSFGKIIPEKFQTPALLFLLLLLIVLFFEPIFFGGKTVASGDLIQVKSLREYATKERDGFSLWNPYIFCGMPAVTTSMSLRWFDLTADIYSYASKIYSAAFSDYNTIYTFNFLILGFTSFFFMRSFGASRGVSFLTASSVTFSSGIVVLFYIGHITKLMSLAIFPFILMMLFKFQKEIKLFDILLYILGMHILVLGAHVQIVFYFVLASVIYFIYFFVHSFVTRNKFLQNQLLKSLGITAIAGVIALAMSFDTYAQLYQYKPYSTRGTQSITETQNPEKPSQANSYEYNTNWSFSPGEVLTFIVPSYFGFGKSTYQGPLTNNQPVDVNTYFGQMPHVDTAMYMGVIIFSLALFALFTRWKEPIVQFFGILVILFILISFGKNFPVIFNLFYYYFPLFDNFRVPSMILHVLQIIFPILAGLGVMKIISLRDEKNQKIEKVVKNITIVFAALFVFSLLLGGSLSNWFTQRVNNYASALGQNQEAQMFTALADYMSGMFTGDLQIALALLTITFGLSYAYAVSKINKELLIAGFVVVILFDLFRIGSRGASYTDASQMNDLFREPDYISVIKQQNDKEQYRILNLKQDGSMGTFQNNANFNVYFLQEDFYGYSAVKPRSYQDIIETVSPINVTLWRMLGVKYVVTDRPYSPDGFVNIHQSEKTFIYRNEKTLPRIYFVDSVAQKSSAKILNEIKNDSFDPKKLAYVENTDFKLDRADSNATAKIVSYNDEQITVEAKCPNNNFLFFGTTYLPGWKAFVDGAEIKIYKTNYGFQGVVVPKGDHKVEFIYEPAGFAAGKYLSLILNIFLFGSLGITFFVNRKRQPNNTMVE
ncbi:MAG: YfhO family protein [Ignavibacteriales bacterium]|nr:YfhO family protein [Ignavibacteriales bacterium]